MRATLLSLFIAFLIAASFVFLIAAPVQAITPCWKAIQTMEDGKGFKECARLYEEDGDSRAALYLSGIALLRGDEESAMNWLWEATLPTKQYPDGLPDAQYKMGKIVLYGKYNEEIDTTVAYNLFHSAADQGSVPAYYEYARMLERGIGYRASDIAEATDHYSTLLAHKDFEPARLRLAGLCGDADSAYELAEYYLVGDATSIDLPEKDLEETFLFFLIAFHLDHEDGEKRVNDLSEQLTYEQLSAAEEQFFLWQAADFSKMKCYVKS